jgi:hypothetical protein
MDGNLKIYYHLLRRELSRHLIDFHEEISVGVLVLIHKQAAEKRYIMSIHGSMDGKDLGEKLRTVLESAIH